MNKTIGIIFGALVVLAGVIYGLSSLGVGIDISFDGWWTLFIIVPCIGGLFTSRDKFGNAVGLAVGILLLLAARDVITYKIVWKLILTAVIILIGVKMIIKTARGEKTDD